METQASSPVMDVKAPPAREAKPVDEVATAPPEEKIDTESKSEAKAESKEKSKVHTQAKSAAAPSNGVGMAITATVIIVFGLAAIATYAYLQQ